MDAWLYVSKTYILLYEKQNKVKSYNLSNEFDPGPGTKIVSLQTGLEVDSISQNENDQVYRLLPKNVDFNQQSESSCKIEQNLKGTTYYANNSYLISIEPVPNVRYGIRNTNQVFPQIVLAPNGISSIFDVEKRKLIVFPVQSFWIFIIAWSFFLLLQLFLYLKFAVNKSKKKIIALTFFTIVSLAGIICLFLLNEFWLGLVGIIPLFGIVTIHFMTKKQISLPQQISSPNSPPL